MSTLTPEQEDELLDGIVQDIADTGQSYSVDGMQVNMPSFKQVTDRADVLLVRKNRKTRKMANSISLSGLGY